MLQYSNFVTGGVGLYCNVLVATVGVFEGGGSL